jgi:nucleotide-binding universal stress UspA family protein
MERAVYATLMVYVDPEGPTEHVVGLAVELADKFGSKLIGVAAVPPDPPIVVNGAVAGPDVQLEFEQAMRWLAAAESRFRERATAPHRSIDWRSGREAPAAYLALQARCADLLIVSRNEELFSSYALDAGSAVLKAGRPVLVAPPGVRSLKTEHIVIAWKNTREARRALQDSLPFLHAAKRITIAEICREDEQETIRGSINDVAGYLLRHRLKVQSNILLSGEGVSAAQLTQFAQDEGADLLVTGAYGHSRLGEWIFGGMTHELLTLSPMCCLMSH